MITYALNYRNELKLKRQCFNTAHTNRNAITKLVRLSSELEPFFVFFLKRDGCAEIATYVSRVLQRKRWRSKIKSIKLVLFDVLVIFR